MSSPFRVAIGLCGVPCLVADEMNRDANINHEAFRDQDPTPRANNEPWRFTPSLLDPNSFTFSSFANQPGYYASTPGGTNTLYHPQAGDLHTPTLSLNMGLGTPLSLPTTEGGLHAGAPLVDMPNFQHTMNQHHFHPFNPFIQPPPPQAAFAPSTFVHQDTGYETMDQDGSPMVSEVPEERIASIEGAFQGQPPMMGYQARQFGIPMQGLQASAERFRFHSTLNAPTAMIKSADEIPVTYLNKGQAYSLSIVDTNATLPLAPGTRYRTYVRISFEDEQQRQKPAVCWSLWKEGRGTNEAHQRGGKLQAVEYVEGAYVAAGEEKRTRIELESASFDGFSVIWTPGAQGAAECNIAVRFNFLSTDFSHSKGVKGIPVRLCAKTSLYPADSSPTAAPSENQAAEICYCKVKLFRDHGAERKLSNDVAHVKKSIDKLKQQIAQAESGMKDFSKRKRGSAAQNKGMDAQGPGKVIKHKRTWSMSSTSSAGGGNGGGGGRLSIEDDLHLKLQTLQDMFTSTRPVSVLYLRGEEGDDPDLNPVILPGEPLDLTKVDSRDSAWQAGPSGRSSVGGSSLVSPSPSSLSLHSQISGANAQWQDFQGVGAAADGGGPRLIRRGSEQPTKVVAIKGSSDNDAGGSLSRWIEALGVDPAYKPPPERVQKPVACFYVLLQQSQAATATPEQQPAAETRKTYHRAVYLMERTLAEFVARVTAKWGIDRSRVVRTVHMSPLGLEVEMDDDVIRELAEGQDMVLEVVSESTAAASASATSVSLSPETKQEWDMAVDVSPTAAMGESSRVEAAMGGIELRLTF